MKKIISTALFVSVLLFTAQNVDAQSDTREVGPLDGVHIAGPYEVTLTSGKEGTISLSGDDEDLENIESYIKKGKLIIKKKNKSWLSDWTSGKVTIRIPIEEISSVILSGSGKIKSQKTITANRFKTVISGSGDIDLEVELATYAMWWIKAAIQEFVLKSWSQVKIGTTASQKKLFFNLRKIKGKINALEDGDLSPTQVNYIAKTLDVERR